MGKAKKKCCRSKPVRCAECPVVAVRLGALDLRGLTGKELRRAVKRARKY